MARSLVPRFLFALGGCLLLLSVLVVNQPAVLAVCDPNAPVMRASVGFDESDANNESSWETISANGRYVAYASFATDIVAGDDNSKIDVFVYDRQLCANELISISTTGEFGDGDSTYPVISGDGRYVAFFSAASDLVNGDTNGIKEYYLRDRQTATTIRLAPSGVQPNQESFEAQIDISDDGRYVVFASPATNMHPDDTDDSYDLYVYDTTTAAFSIASRLPAGTKIVDGTYNPSISADGRYIAFISGSPNIVTPDTNGTLDVFVKDMQTGLIKRISDWNGQEANQPSNLPDISGNGRFIIFTSGASNLSGGDAAFTNDVFLFDDAFNTLTRITPGTSAFGGVTNLSSISSNGRYITFSSDWNGFVPNDTNSTTDVFRYDRDTASVIRVSLAADASQANGGSGGGRMSADGSVIVFASFATSLVTSPVDINASLDIFSVQPALQIPPTATNTPTSSNTPTRTPTYTPSMTFTPSPTFTPTPSNTPTNTQTPTNTLTPSPTNTPLPVVCGFDPNTAIIQRVGVSSTGAQPNNSLQRSIRISHDGRYIAFDTFASNMIPNDINTLGDVFVHDRLTCQTLLVSQTTAGVQPTGVNHFLQAISPNGRYVAFMSSSGFVTGDNNNQSDLYIRDLDTGETLRASVSSTGAQSGAGYLNFDATFSTDSRYLTFLSDSALAQPQGINTGGLFSFDIATRTISKINLPLSNNQIQSLTVSANRQFVAFATYAQLLVQDVNSLKDVYLYDVNAGTLLLATRGYNGAIMNESPSTNGNATTLVISDDGRYVMYQSGATNLVAEDLNGDRVDVFLFDRLTNSVELISQSSGNVPGGGDAPGDISADGRYVTFSSHSYNLVPDTSAAIDNGFVFVRDRQLGYTWIVSQGATGNPPFATGFSSQISGSGEVVAFASYNSSLVTPDTNSEQDVFVTRWQNLPLLQPGDELLIYGGFEDGQISRYPDISYSWLEASTNFGTPLCTVADCGDGGGGALPRSGTWWAWLGGSDQPEVSTVSQGIRIPPVSAELSFYLWVGLDQTTAAEFSVLVDGTEIYSVPKPFTGFLAGYTRVALDMSAYADGQLHDLTFRAETTGGVGQINLDDVSLLYLEAPPATATYTPSPTSTATSTPTPSNTPTNTPTRTPTSTPTNTPAPVTFTGRAMWQGRPAFADPSWISDLHVRVETFDGSQVLLTTTVTTDNTGLFTIPGLMPGAYRFRFKGDHTLSVVMPISNFDGTGVYQVTPLREGDADNSNTVTLVDFSLLAATFNKQLGQAGYDDRADFNNDDRVTLPDFSLLASNFGQAGAN